MNFDDAYAFLKLAFWTGMVLYLFAAGAIDIRRRWRK